MQPESPLCNQGVIHQLSAERPSGSLGLSSNGPKHSGNGFCSIKLFTSAKVSFYDGIGAWLICTGVKVQCDFRATAEDIISRTKPGLILLVQQQCGFVDTEGLIY